ncbi:S8 family serine peptidase, partial [Halorubrum sp. Eb13]|uniref:S8 family serine peptidase n=2 Tax=unclassified Halorubrum TaxID=2642239 RepID=UPI001140098F
MSNGAGRPGRATVLLVVACVLAAALAPAAAAAGGLGEAAVDRPAVGVDAASTSPAPSPSPAPATATPPATPTSLGAASSDAVGPGLRSANGTVELVVRFGDDAGTGARRAADGGRIGTDELKTNAATAQGSFERFAERKPGVTVERSFWLANAMLVTADTESVAVERLLDVRGVERVHENFRMELDSAATADGGAGAGALDSPAGPTAGTVSAGSTATNATYGVEMVRAPEVWETFGTRGEGATVAVIDTGIDPNHPDLTVSGWAEYDTDGNLVSDNVSDASDGNGHGTHVAGTVAGGNESGTAIGVAPAATLHGVKVFDDDGGNATFTRVVAGMEHASEDPEVDVLQMSLGADGYAADMIEPVRNARDAGKIVVASSGNRDLEPSSSPGNIYDTLGVGAVDSDREVPSFSGGENVSTDSAWGNDAPSDWPDQYVVPDVSAPGVSVNSAAAGGGYRNLTGTSMAAPHVSGVAALMISVTSRNVTDEELSDTLRDTANHPDDATGPDTRYGAGIVDGFAAVSSVTENRSTLAVSDFDAPTEVAPGETLEPTATVENTGSDPGVGAVEYRFDGAVGDEANVSLAPGESATVSFTYVVPSDTPTNATDEHGVYTRDSNRTAAVDVLDPPSYEVSALRAPAFIERNGSLDATATVANVGGLGGENRTVELRLTDPANASDVRVLDAANVSIGAGNATAVALNGTVPSGFATGETTVAVASSEDAADATVGVADAVGTVNGTVTDAETDATLPGISVVVNDGSAAIGETTTDADGTYAMSAPATGLNVTAGNATYAPANRTVTLNESGDAAVADFALTLRNGTLSGDVNATDGLDRPATATVTVTDAETDATVASLDVGEGGTYAVDLRPNAYDVAVDAPDFEPMTRTSIRVRPNATTDPSLALDPKPASLIGTVTNASDGGPVAGATATADGRAATADSNGSYSLAVARGERTVTVSADGYADVTETATLAANETREVNASLAPRGVFTLTGLSGPAEIERGSSGEFDVAVLNEGRAADDAAVSVAVDPSGSVSPNSVSIAGVAVDDTGSGTFTVSTA